MLASLTDVLAVRKSDLVAIRRPPGPEWPGLIAEIWEAGAAVFPVDSRLPDPEVQRLIRVARPTAILDADDLVRLDAGIPAADGIALVVATSGTSGPPKAAELDHDAVRAAVEASAKRLGSTDRDRWLGCLPLAHMGGLLIALRAVLLGAPIAIHPRFDPAAFATERDVRFTSLVPTMLTRLLDAGADLSRMRGILVGGGGLDEDLRARAREARAPIVATYGLTETCGGVVYDGVPLDGTAVRISPSGEIQLRGPTLLRNYRGRARPRITADGWLRTGDAGALDANGILLVRGRIDDRIDTAGERVWPREVEERLRAHPAVADAAVAGRPDAEWGARVVAYVVATNPGTPPTLQELRAFVAKRLARHKAPRELVILDTLPRTASGKIRRGALGRSE